MFGQKLTNGYPVIPLASEVVRRGILRVFQRKTTVEIVIEA
jgi:hypothetical protein